MKLKILSKTEQRRIRGLLLTEADMTVPDISKRFNRTRQFVYQALSGKHQSDAACGIREYVAHKINLNVEELWT